MRLRPRRSLVLCAPVLLCALKLHGGFIHSPTGVVQELTRSCSILRVVAARRGGTRYTVRGNAVKPSPSALKP